MTYYVGRSDLISVFMLFIVGAAIVGALFVSFMTKFKKKKTLLILGLLIGVVFNFKLLFYSKK
jgi:Na+/melibiose symporter-like transporter